jgi:hypothetical protein
MISFITIKNKVEISIYDNGVEREKSKQYSSMSTGKGLQIVNDA